MQNQHTAMQPATKRLGTLAQLLESKKASLAQVLPKHLSPERLVKIAISACSKNPALLNCTPESVYLAVSQSAQLGLEPGGVLGGAYLVPYKNTCQLIVGYRGLIDLARRSGQIASIEAHVVRDGDEFALEFGLTPKLMHRPRLDGGAPGPMKFAYAIARLRDGSTQYEVMTKAEIDAIRARSRSSTSGPWVSDYDEMARKTVLRRLCKYLPLSTELASALDGEEQGEAQSNVAAIEVMPEVVVEPESPPEPPSRTSSVRAKLKQARDESPPMVVVSETKGMRIEVEPDAEFESPPDFDEPPPPSDENR